MRQQRQQRQCTRLAVVIVFLLEAANGSVNAGSAFQRVVSMPFGSSFHPSLVLTLRAGATEEEKTVIPKSRPSSSKKKKKAKPSASTKKVPSASASTTKKSPDVPASDHTTIPDVVKASSSTLKPKKKASNKATQSHARNDLKSSSPNYRIQRELKAFLADPPPNLSVSVGKNIRVWIVTIHGAAGSIYDGEVFRLRIAFPAQYPTVPPSVYFLGPNIPIHEHVYTNGDICLSLLGKDWRPTMTAQSIAVSIMSILSSALSKSLPMDNAQHAGNKPGQYQKDWVYHDDNC